MDNLPKGWYSKTVGDVLEKIMTGTTPPMNEPKYYLNPSIYWYSPSDFNDSNKILPEPSRKLDRVAIDEGKAKLYKKNSLLLVAIGATIGKIGLIKEQSCSNQQITALEFNRNVLPDFGYYWFKHIKSEIIKNASAATLPIINQNGIKQLPFPLPPLSEQTRIVAKLDTLFARIDKSIVLLEENVKHTKALMASVLEEVFRDSENKWKCKTLKTATSKIGSGSTPRGGQSAYQSFGISLIRSMNVHDGEFRHSGLAFIDDEQARKLQSVSVEKDDVLLNITGASVARCTIVDESILPARVNQHVSIIRTKSILNPHFLQAYLICPATKSKLIFNSSGGATREAITKTMIENLEVPIPSIHIQENINRYIQKVKEANLKIIVEQQSKLVYLKALKSSLLDRAFKGEL